MHWAMMEVVKRQQTIHHRSERLRNTWVRHVGVMYLSVDIEFMQFRRKCRRYLRSCAAELQHASPLRDLHLGEAMLRQPSLQCVQVLLCHTEPRTEFLRRQPVVIFG